MSNPNVPILSAQEFLDRLENLRRTTGKTREEIYSMIGISRAMVHLVKKKGQRVSQKMLEGLEEAELLAGIRRFDPTETKILDRILGKPPKARFKPTPDDLDLGQVKIPLEFRRGKPPKEYDSFVLLKAPDSRTAAGIMVELLLEEDYDNFIGHCLPPDVDGTDLLNQLTPESYLKLAEACLALTLGLNWEKQLPNLAQGFREKVRP